MGVQVTPAFVVFQTPPEPTARYQVAGVVGVDGDVGDAAAHQGRADASEGEATGGFADEGGVRPGGLGARVGRRSGGGKDGEPESGQRQPRRKREWELRDDLAHRVALRW